MPLTRKSPTVQARLAPADFTRFSEVAKADKKTKGQLAREAILFYLANREHTKWRNRDRVITNEIDRLSKVQVTAIRSMADRLAAMLFRLQVDVGVVYELHATVADVDVLEKAQNKTKDRLHKRLESDEKTIRDRISRTIAPDNP